jgi:hypothetical protein
MTGAGSTTTERQLRTINAVTEVINTYEIMAMP